MTESDLHSQGRRVREAARELAQATDTQRRAVLELTDAVGYRYVEDLDDLSGRPRILVARR